MNIARLSDGPAGRWAGAFAIVLLLVVTAAGCATTPSQDYRCDVLQQPVQVGPNTEITVRLVHLPSGQAVKGAIISKSELEMPMLWPGYKQVVPSGLSLSDVHIEYLGSDAQGDYHFRGNVLMAGTWTLNLSARVPGETESIRGAVRFNAVS
jgi:hypothetical protein